MKRRQTLEQQFAQIQARRQRVQTRASWEWTVFWAFWRSLQP